MEYFQSVLNRGTGELVEVSQGHWITITEMGEAMGVGPRHARSVLREMGFLMIEGSGRNSRHRLAPWVTAEGLGKRLSPKAGFPFDVIGPAAQAWIMARWSKTEEEVARLSSQGQQARDHLRAFLDRRADLAASPQGQVMWLCDFYPGLSQSEKGKIVGVSQQLVSRYETKRSARLNLLQDLRSRFPTP